MNILKFLPLNFVLWDLNKWINNELMSSRKPASSYIIKKSSFILKLKSSPTRAKNISQSKNQGIKSIALDSYHYYKKVSSYLGLHFLLLLPSVVIEVDIDKEALLLCLWLNFPATEKKRENLQYWKTHNRKLSEEKYWGVFHLGQKLQKLVSVSLWTHFFSKGIFKKVKRFDIFHETKKVEFHPRWKADVLTWYIHTVSFPNMLTGLLLC